MIRNDETLTTRQAAELLGYDYGYFRQLWPKLIIEGVNPIRLRKGCHPRFYRSELERLRVVKR